VAIPRRGGGSARHHAAGADQLEELQIPREAMVVTALHGLMKSSPGRGRDPPRRRGFSAPSILDDLEGASASSAEVMG